MPGTWLDLLTAIARRRLIALNPGCSAEDIEHAESELGVAVPQPLAEFLRASNGLADLESRYEYGWDIKTIVAENRRAWSDTAMRLDSDLLGFGADGAGGWFCLSLAHDDKRVFHYVSIDGSATPVADDLRTFWPSWLSGELTV